MRMYKIVVVLLLLCISLPTRAYTHTLGAALDYGLLSLLVGMTSFELNRLEECIKQLRFEESQGQENPYHKYNLEVARSNVATMAFSSAAFSLMSIHVLLQRPSTFGYTFMKLVTGLNLVVGCLLANDYWKLDKKHKELWRA